MSELWKVSGKRLALTPTERTAPSRPWRITARPGGWLVATAPDGTRRRFVIAQASGRLGASVGGRLFQGELQTARSSSAAGGGGAASDLVAQFPGKVRKLLVREGDRVREGAPLLSVEAMKMEFSIKAPFAGKVTRILVQEGQQLAPGDRYVDLEASGADQAGAAHAGEEKSAGRNSDG